MNKAEVQAKAQEGSAHIVRGYEILREIAEADHDEELMQMIDEQLGAFRQITKLFQN